MVTLPRLRCPDCGKAMGPVKAKEVPPANKYEDCLRRCEKCRIGATNAKNPAKVKYIRDGQPVEPAEPTPAEPTPPPTNP